MRAITHRWVFLVWFTLGLSLWKLLPDSTAVNWIGCSYFAVGCAFAATFAFLGAMSIWRTAGLAWTTLVLAVAITALGVLVYNDRNDVVTMTSSTSTSASVESPSCMLPAEPSYLYDDYRYGYDRYVGYVEYKYGHLACPALSQRGGEMMWPAIRTSAEACASADVAVPPCYDAGFGRTRMILESLNLQVEETRAVSLNPRSLSIWASTLGLFVALVAGATGSAWARVGRHRRDGEADGKGEQGGDEKSETIAETSGVDISSPVPTGILARVATVVWASESIEHPDTHSMRDPTIAVDSAGTAIVLRQPFGRRQWVRSCGNARPALVGLGWMFFFLMTANTSSNDLVADSTILTGLLVGICSAFAAGIVRVFWIRKGWVKAVVLGAALFFETILVMNNFASHVPAPFVCLAVGLVVGPPTEMVWRTITGAAYVLRSVWGLAADTSRSRSEAGRWAVGISCLAVVVVGGDTEHRAGFKDVWLPDLDTVGIGRNKLIMAGGQLAGACRIRFLGCTDALRDAVDHRLAGNGAVTVAAVLASIGMAVNQIIAAQGVNARVVAAVLAAGGTAAAMMKLAQVWRHGTDEA